MDPSLRCDPGLGGLWVLLCKLELRDDAGPSWPFLDLFLTDNCEDCFGVAGTARQDDDELEDLLA